MFYLKNPSSLKKNLFHLQLLPLEESTTTVINNIKYKNYYKIHQSEYNILNNRL
jgi:hypothetical protein